MMRATTSCSAIRPPDCVSRISNESGARSERRIHGRFSYQCPRVIWSLPPENVGGSSGNIIWSRNAPVDCEGKLAGPAFGSDPKKAAYAPGLDEENVNSPLWPEAMGSGLA